MAVSGWYRIGTPGLDGFYGSEGGRVAEPDIGGSREVAVPEIGTDADLKKHCGAKAGICVLALLDAK